MRKNIFLFGCLASAIVWMVYAFGFFHSNASRQLSPERFFAQTDTVYSINYPNETAATAVFKTVLFQNKQVDSLAYWLQQSVDCERIYFQKNTTTGISKLLLEGKQNFSETQIKKILEKLQLPAASLYPNELQQLGMYYVLLQGKYLAFSLTTFDLQDKNLSELSFSAMDKEATYNIISANERTDVYAHQGEKSVFITQTNKNHYRAASDNDFYAVMPATTSQFLFIEKQLLIATYPEWKGNSLLQAMDKGWMQTVFQGKKVVYFELAGNYTPNELKDIYCGENVNKNASVVPLNLDIPEMHNPFATCIENIVILCEDERTLNDIRVLYQVGKLYNTCTTYKQFYKSSPQLVNARWEGNWDLSALQIGNSSQGNLVYQEKAGQRIFSWRQSASPVKEAITEKTTYKLLWTSPVGNASAIETTSGIVAVWDKEANAVTLVNVEGQLQRKITTERNYLKLHALTNGFVLIGKTNMLWIPIDTQKKEIAFDFEEQLQNIAADYTWEGRQELAFLSEGKLICFDVERAKSIKFSLKSTQAISNFYAFNLSGNLAFSLTNSEETMVFNTKSKQTEHFKRDGKIVAVEKINRQVLYVLKNQDGFSVQQNDEAPQKLAIPAEYVFFAFQHTENLTCLVLRRGTQFSVYDINKGTLSHFTSPTETVEKAAIVSVENSKNRIFFLDGVQNNIFLQTENESTTSSNHLEGSRFVFSKSSKQLLTYLDGNLVCYEFTN